MSDEVPQLDGRRASREGLAPSRHRAKKDRRRWCGGRVGREHEPIVELNDRGKRFEPRRYPHWDTWQRTPCWYPPWWASRRYHCNHHMVCRNCGKVLRVSMGPDCPTRP